MASSHPRGLTALVLIALSLLVIALLATPAEAFGEVVNRTFCPNRCNGVGDCLNMTQSDEFSQTYTCDCKYKSKYNDCSDQTRVPIGFSLILLGIVLVIFILTFGLFTACNREFDSRQKYISANSVLAR